MQEAEIRCEITSISRPFCLLCLAAAEKKALRSRLDDLHVKAGYVPNARFNLKGDCSIQSYSCFLSSSIKVPRKRLHPIETQTVVYRGIFADVMVYIIFCLFAYGFAWKKKHV